MAAGYVARVAAVGVVGFGVGVADGRGGFSASARLGGVRRSGQVCFGVIAVSVAA